jgi:hypothetical protein
MGENIETTKLTQGRLQKVSKMELRRLLKRDIWNKEDSTDMKDEFNKNMESLREKNQTEILEIVSSLSQIKKYSWKPFQQTGTYGKQNFRPQRQNSY